jgi:hypothetical protein
MVDLSAKTPHELANFPIISTFQQSCPGYLRSGAETLISANLSTGIGYIVISYPGFSLTTHYLVQGKRASSDWSQDSWNSNPTQKARIVELLTGPLTVATQLGESPSIRYHLLPLLLYSKNTQKSSRPWPLFISEEQSKTAP